MASDQTVHLEQFLARLAAALGRATPEPGGESLDPGRAACLKLHEALQGIAPR